MYSKYQDRGGGDLVLEVSSGVLLDDLVPLAIDEYQVRCQGLLGRCWIFLSPTPPLLSLCLSLLAFPCGASFHQGGSCLCVCLRTRWRHHCTCPVNTLLS